MFVSANYLAINYGIDDTIARFFTDREPPAGNLYWKEKLMYLRPQTGWLFIPLIVDLFYKCGLPKAGLLSEDFVGLMERIGHISAEEELKLISHDELIQKAAQLTGKSCKNEDYFNNVMDFIKGGSNNPFTVMSKPFKALHRGDAFLLSLCAIEFEHGLDIKLVQYWFALISTLLLLDDAEDLEADKISGDENAFLESGLTKEGVRLLKDMIAENLELISLVNKPMTATLSKKFASLSKMPHISELISQ